MSGRFELSKSKDGQFRFVLKSGNSETILTSELYRSRAAALNGVASVRRNCASDERYERKTSANGKVYFNLKAGNHQVIGTSQMYAGTQSLETGIASVKRNGISEDLRDDT